MNKKEKTERVLEIMHGVDDTIDRFLPVVGNGVVRWGMDFELEMMDKLIDSGELDSHHDLVCRFKRLKSLWVFIKSSVVEMERCSDEIDEIINDYLMDNKI